MQPQQFVRKGCEYGVILPHNVPQPHSQSILDL